MNETHVKPGGLPLVALRAFEAAARHASFREGAAEVGLTPSAVSHHVRQLEAMLGVSLFERLHRRVRLTPQGAALAASLSEGFGVIARGFTAARAPRDRLVVSASPGFAARWLLPALQVLRAEGTDVHLEVTSVMSDVAGGACDVAIRMAERPPPRLHATRLATSLLVLVTSPERMAGRAGLSVEEIAAGPLLGQAIGAHFWPEALRALGATGNIGAEVRFDSFDTALQAAEAGHGIAFAPELLVSQRIADGSLALAYPRRMGRRRAWSYWFVTRPEIADGAAVRRLRALLQKALAQEA